MRVTYPQIPFWRFRFLMLAGVLIFAYVGVQNYLAKGSWIGIVFFVLTLVLCALNFNRPIRIAENNRLYDGWGSFSFCVDIFTIDAVEYRKKGGIEVLYMFGESERRHTYMVQDKDRETLVSQLKQINPDIKFKRETNDEV